MQRAGFEADRNRIMLYDRTHGTLRELTTGLDQTTHNATWSSDSRKLFFIAKRVGRRRSTKSKSLRHWCAR
ncbi:MAG: hypothetical protein R3C56_11095 [Pirellulaceae bacterium]